VEFGESATEALKREMAEETGLEAEIGSFRGVVENSFMQKGARHCEMNLVFDMDIPSLRNGAEVVARESWIEFEWVKTDALAEAALLPEEFRRIGKEPSAFFRPHMV
jgi:ADP-ribose pyrophosphatase YjhB (NUDIX family)